MKNMKVAAKLITGFLISTTLTVLVGIIGIVGLTIVDSSYSEIIETDAKPLDDIAIALMNLQLTRVDMRNAILNTGNLDELGKIESSAKEHSEAFEISIEAYMKTIHEDNVRKACESARKIYASTYKPALLETIDGAQKGMEQTALMRVLTNTTAAVTEMTDNFSQAMNFNSTTLDQTSEDNSNLSNMLFFLLLAILIGSMIISVTLALYISGLISKPLITLTAFLKKAGTTGNLTLRPEDMENISNYTRHKDELGQCIAAEADFIGHVTNVSKALEVIAGGDLTEDFVPLSDQDTMGVALKKMTEHLSQMFGEVNTSTAHVSTSAKQVAETATSIASSATQMASGAQSLAEGATKQSASVELLTGSIAEVAKKTQANVSMTEQAAQLAQVVIAKAEQGSRQMDEMISAVNDITEASKSIRIIIETIDSIALQTNLLALNAAIEAAQAGEHGKGFAVVAEEVRKLAGQSAEAVQETSSVIQNSMQKTELGARVANEMAASLTEIVASINESNQLITEIARASEEQSSSISHINSTIDQVAQVVHQNSATAQESAAAAEESAAAAEESAAAADEMSSQSTLLEKAISRFKTKDPAINKTTKRQGLSSAAKIS